MIVKWIRCHVVDADAFDRAQRGWSGLVRVPGFLGQLGGWSRREPDVAHVFGLWRKPRDHDAFLAGAHDQVAAGQTGTYDTIHVRLFERLLNIGDEFGATGSFVRLAHCHVRDGRREHFGHAQNTVWNPGMSTTQGMLGGVFARRGEDKFLVLSSWASEADHERYLSGRFPELRRRAGAAEDLASITGDLIQLVPEWIVTPL